jgi:hypothetical protein
MHLRLETVFLLEYRTVVVTDFKQFIAWEKKYTQVSHCLVGIRHTGLPNSSEKLTFLVWRVQNKKLQ